MSADPYSAMVRQLFAEPRHAGEVASGTSVRAAGQDVRIALSAALSGERLARLRFRAWGCPHFIAAAEWFCANYEGRNLSDLDDFRAPDLVDTLPVPIHKTGRILILEDAVRLLADELGGQRTT